MAVSGPKRREHAVFERILQVSHLRSYRQMVQHYAFPQATVTRRALSGAPIEPLWLDRVALWTGCRVEWLLTGEGPIYREERTLESLSPQARALLTRFEDHLSPRGRDLLLRFAEVVEWLPEELEPMLALIEGAALKTMQATPKGSGEGHPVGGLTEEARERRNGRGEGYE